MARLDYDGFVSYSHAERVAAKALQRIVQRLGRRWYRLPAVRLFRDDTSLAPSAALWSSIEDALRRSRKFILLASPESAGSQWVGDEVEWWRENRSCEDFIIVRTGGVIAWDGEDFDWAATTALPEALSGWFSTEPLWVDLVDVDRREFRSRAASVAAAVHGPDTSKEQLLSEDARQLRHLVTLLSGLLVIALTGMGVAAWQWSSAAAERADARSRALAAQSEILRSTAPPDSVLQALAAWHTAPTPEARAALIEVGNSSYRGRVSTSVPDAGTHHAISPDGRTLVNVDTEPSGDLIRVRPGHRSFAVEPGENVHALAVSSGGTDIAIAHSAISVVHQDGSSERISLNASHLAFSHEGTELAAVVGSKVWLRGTDPAWFIAGTEAVDLTSVAVADGGRLIAAGTSDGRVFLWRNGSRSQPEVLSGHTAAVPVLAFGPDRRTLASASADGTVRLWDMAGGARTLPGAVRVPRTLAFSPYDQTLMLHGSGETQIWDTRSGTLVESLTNLDDLVTASYFTDDHEMITVGTTGVERRWTTRRNVLRDKDGMFDVTFADPGHVITAGFTGLRSWSPADRSQTGTFASSSYAPHVAVSPNGSTVAADAIDTSVQLWQWPEHGERTVLKTADPAYSVGAGLGFVNDDTLISATKADRTIRFWDLRTSTSTEKRLDINTFLSVLVVQGGMFATGDGKGDVQFWDSNTRTPLAEARAPQPDSISALAFSADGTRLASASGSSVQLWDVATRAPIGTPLSHQTAGIKSIAFSPDGTLLAAGGTDHQIRLWNTATSELLTVLRGHTERVGGITFSPDGKTLLSTDDAGAMTLWTVEVTEIHRSLCAVLAGDDDVTGRWPNLVPGSTFQDACPPR